MFGVISSTLTSWRHLRLREFQRIFSVFLAVLVGGGVGMLVIASQSSSKWQMVLVIALLAPSVALLVKDVKKLLLIAFVVDIPLQINISIQHDPVHQGGPAGYVVALTTVGLIVGYILWVIERKPKPQFFLGVTGPALLFIFMSMFSFYLSPNWSFSLKGLLLRLQVFFMFFYVLNHIQSWANIRLIVIVSVLCLLFESVLMILQYFIGASLDFGGLVTSQAIEQGGGGDGVAGARVSGTLLRPGSAALYLNCMLPLALGSFLTGLMDKRLALITFLLGIVALFATSSRGGWLSFGIAMLFMISRIVWTRPGKMVIPIVLIGGLLMSIFFGPQIQQRLVTLEGENSREYLATTALNIIRAYPYGLGENTYELYVSDKYAHPDLVGKKFGQPHDTYLLIWAELGPQGLVAFIILLAAGFWQISRWLFRGKGVPADFIIIGTGFVTGLIAYMIHMRSESFYGMGQVQLLWLIIAVLAAMNRLTDRNNLTIIRS